MNNRHKCEWFEALSVDSYFMCLIMLMANRRCRVELCCVCCAICLLACECIGFGSTKTFDGNGEGQLRSPCAMDREW
jgi:hypothetical protein